MDFSECLHWIGNRAESPSTNDEIKGSVAIGQGFSGDMLDANGKGLAGASFCDDLVKKIGRIDGMEPGNGLGVVRQVQPSPYSQFQHLPVDLSEQPCAKMTEFFSRHDPVHQTGKYMMTIESHRSA